MEYEFNITIGLIGGHGDGGEVFVDVDLTEEECASIRKYVKDTGNDIFVNDENINDIAAKVADLFKEQQLSFGFDDSDLLASYAGEHDLTVGEMTEDDIWDAFCEYYDYNIQIPDEFFEEDEDCDE